MAWDLAAVCPNEERLLTIVDPLLRNSLVAADTGAKVAAEDAGYLRLTVAGAYYLSSLHSRFAYLDQVCTDTPTCDRGRYEQLLEADRSVNEPGLTAYIRMIRRVGRVKVFLDYLHDAAVAEQDALAKLPPGQSVWTRTWAGSVITSLRKATQSWSASPAAPTSDRPATGARPSGLPRAQRMTIHLIEAAVKAPARLRPEVALIP